MFGFPVFTSVFVLAVISGVILELWLILRQKRAVQSHQDRVPAAFSDNISLEAHQKAAVYTLDKIRFGQVELIYSSILLLFWTLGGGLDYIDTLWRAHISDEIWRGITVIFSAGLAMSLLGLPFALYSTFVIEQKHGFNRTSGKLFIIDLIKNLLVSVMMLTPLLWVILWLMQDAAPYWWVTAWVVFIGFNLLMMWAYPAFIAPLFNKFAPLDDAELRERIENLLSRCGFASNGIFIMDGSKRSSHGNAYFTGLGSNKRIVFFDTLLKSLQPKEIEAVLAHELGHFKRKHIRKRFISIALFSLAGLALLGWLMKQSWFYHDLGVSQASTYIALMLFMLVTPVFSQFFQPLMSHFSRKHEFEADAFAAEQSDAGDLIRALVKLYEENASTLTPDPLYSAFHDSHPPAPVRIAHLSSTLKAGT